MKIYSSSGYECEKELKNSPEDMFNKSDVIYDHKGKQKNLNVTYLRYFEKYLQEENIYDPDNHTTPFYQIAALLILMKNNGYVQAERLYYNDTEQFLHAFNQEDIEEALSIYQSLK